MSQLVLDDQLDVIKIQPGLKNWTNWVRLQELRPGEHILDERVPEILRTCHTPTFVTIDPDFWQSNLCHNGYCIVFVHIDFRQQRKLPPLVRKLFNFPGFKTRAQRMGKVIRLAEEGISYWELGADSPKLVAFSKTPRKRRRKR
ncbi:MAG: hypothetical protein L0Y72_23925 [Gemmataceae bacterium]|nr:hypothetical protein [Gemmataceae bacterium]MCI0742094.1 hypothetical protein [Gemmataceae bacterium]